MPRSYSAEYAARKAAAERRGFASYRAERLMRARARALGLDPNDAPVGDFPTATDEEPHGVQGPFGPSPAPDWDYYWPTRTSNPNRKYTQMARYSRNERRLEVVFRDGTPWHWTGVDALAWNFFKRWQSARPTYDFIRPEGSPIRSEYGTGHRGGWGSIVGE